MGLYIGYDIREWLPWVTILAAIWFAIARYSCWDNLSTLISCCITSTYTIPYVCPIVFLWFYVYMHVYQISLLLAMFFLNIAYTTTYTNNNNA